MTAHHALGILAVGGWATYAATALAVLAHYVNRTTTEETTP